MRRLAWQERFIAKVEAQEELAARRQQQGGGGGREEAEAARRLKTLCDLYALSRITEHLGAYRNAHVVSRRRAHAISYHLHVIIILVVGALD